MKGLLDTNPRRAIAAASMAAASALFMVTALVLQDQNSRCEAKRSDDILQASKNMDRDEAYFRQLWAFGFLDPKVFDPAHKDEMEKATGLSAHEFQDDQQTQIEAYNQSCVGWTWAFRLSVLAAFLPQLLSSIIGFSMYARTRNPRASSP